MIEALYKMLKGKLDGCIVKYSEIISKVAYELKKEFQCKVYSDEVLENFY